MRHLWFGTSAAIVMAGMCMPARAADSVYVMDTLRNFVVVEAEGAARTARWSRTTARSGFTGSGYVTWQGPNQSCASLGQKEDGAHWDITGKCQGDSADWLIVPVYISKVGRYIIDCHNTHSATDGDNDVWVHRVGVTPPIMRVGSHHPGKWGWLDWGPDYTNFYVTRPGVHRVYFAGRSPGFGIDRILVYKSLGYDTTTDQYVAPAGARVLTTPVSVKVPLPKAVSTARRSPQVSFTTAGSLGSTTPHAVAVRLNGSAMSARGDFHPQALQVLVRQRSLGTPQLRMERATGR